MRIEVHNIRTQFGAQVVHRDVSFTIAEPSVVALIGGSGTGKTVLLREMLGLLRPYSGTVKLLGVDIWSASEEELLQVRRQCGVLFQNGALYGALTVAENVAVPIREQLGLDESEIEEIVDLKLVLAGLDTRAGAKMPNELSGGMRKRAALARALALDPTLLFLDEPTSGLDPINARSFDRLIRTLVDSLGITALLVSHDLDTLAGIADRIIVLGNGMVLADGSYDQVRQYNDPWIREYFTARVAG